MKKNILLILVFASLNFSFGQILTFEFHGLDNITAPVTHPSEFNHVDLMPSEMSRGMGLTPLANNNGFSANDWSLVDIDDAVTNNKYYEFSVTPTNVGIEFDVTSIVISIKRSVNGPTEIALRSSLDGYTSNIDGIKTMVSVAPASEIITFNVSQTNNASAVTYRIYGTAIDAAGNLQLESDPSVGSDVTVFGSVAFTSPVGCVLSDDFTGPLISGAWTEVGGDLSIVSDQLSIGTGSAVGYDYVYQNVNMAYNTVLETLSNPITWQFNMQQNRTNPNGFGSGQYGQAFVIGGTSADILEGDGYAVVLGETGGNRDVRLVRYTDGLDGTLTDIIPGFDLASPLRRNYFSIRVIYDPLTDDWELFVRDDGSISFGNPTTLGGGHSMGIAPDNTYTSSYLDYIAAVYSHGTDPVNIGNFDNLCISTSFDCSAPTVTWASGAWTPLSGPSADTPVILADNYDTSAQGDLIGCSLTINSGFTLTVADNTFVEIENDVTVDGELVVETQGNFIQNNNVSLFTDNSANGVVLNKTKSVANEFVHTYWSSPVVGETVENVFSTVASGNRYFFNAANFVDEFAEIANNNMLTPGTDDIDDDGDDWQLKTGALTPGIGYSMRTNDVGGAFPRSESFAFGGALNNGIVTVPLVNNSVASAYNDWNLIGNPYPCAIDAVEFFTRNAGLVDAIYFWDQSTAPSNTANGNEGYNFSGADYAMYSAGSGGVAGTSMGSSKIPNGFVASGQGFFVEALSAGDVEFNNTMRLTTNDNSQFFKTKSSKNGTVAKNNKFWINLTSNNGAFNQILVSYVDGATNANDGSFYDLKRPIGTGSKVLFYSLIEDENEKFAIQGRSTSSVNEDEVVKLGMSTKINVPTLYSMSIAQVEGAFLAGKTLYLKDNVLNTIHNLSAGDYTFTAEVGEFNDRFEIVFNTNALSTNEAVISANKFSIISDRDNVTFSTNSDLSIKTINIYDLLGRALYNLKGNASSETYTLSNLNNAIYISKIELSNGTVITKKTVNK